VDVAEPRSDVPRQLPPPPAHFASRDRELSGLDAKARGRASNPGLVVLKGPGGVGKSALALRWLDRTRDRFPDGQLYARLALPSGDPVAVEDVLGEFLRALGVAPDHVPAAFSERVTLFRSVTAGRSVALLLDDAVSAAQVKALLPASPAGVVLVTSRRPLPALFADGAEVVPVEPLDDRGAVDLLTRHVGTERVAAERSAVAALIDFCAGLPIALCVAAAQLVLRPHRPVAKLVADLRDEHRRLDVLSLDDDLSVRATLDLSARALPPDARSAYLSIGAHPGRLVCPELIAATTRSGPARARRALDALVDASLLREIDDEVYQCHDLVRAHARAETAGLDRAARDALTRTTLEWHLQVAREAGAAVLPSRRRVPFQQTGRFELPAGVTGQDGSLRWLERHRLDLSALVRLAADAGLHELAYALGDALQPLFIVHGHRREAVAVDEHALRAAAAMGDHHAQTSMRKRLARVLVDLGETALAQEHIDELIEAGERRGDRRGRASGLKVRARLHARLGRPADAVADCREVVSILREIDQGRAEALALTELGMALLDAGRPADAVPPLTEARDILLAGAPPDPYNAARASIPLARARIRLGDHDGVRALLDAAGRTLEELRSDRRLGRTHETFAELYDATGDHDRAAAHRSRAAELRARHDPAPCSQVD
jgi:tetratricopeptide (TPR) repeat protein